MILEEEVHKAPAPRSWSRPRVLQIFLFPALGGLLFGYDIGATSYVIGQLRDEDASGTQWHGLVEGSALLQGCITSSGVGGALLGSVLVFRVTKLLGTRGEMRVAALLFVLGAGVEFLAGAPLLNRPNTGNPGGQAGGQAGTLGLVVLLAGRWTYGLACGFAMHGAPSYIGELAPPGVRGALVSLKEGMIVMGMLLGYLVGWALEHVRGGWRFTFGLSALPALAMLFGVGRLLPASPRWLCERGEFLEAKRALGFVYTDPAAADGVMSEVLASIDESKSMAAEAQGRGERGGLWAPKNRRGLIVGLGVVTLQQVTGQPSILYYAAGIFKDAGLASYAAVLTGAFKLLMTCASVLLVDRLGRRGLLMAGIGCMALALTVMAGAFYGYQPKEDPEGERALR